MLKLLPLVTKLLKYIPRPIINFAAISLGGLLYYLLRTRRRIIYQNLDFILEVPTYKYQIAKRTFKHFVFNIIDFISIPNLHKLASELFTIVGKEYLVARKGKGFILVTAHLGPWDLGTLVLEHLEFKGVSLMEVNENFNILKLYRQARNIEVFPLNTSPFTLFKHLKKGEVLVLLGDRDLTGGGVSVPFLKGYRKIPDGPAIIAKAAGVPIIIAFCLRKKLPPPLKRPYLLIVNPPIYPDKLTKYELLEEIKKQIEAVIRQYPDQWLVFQPQWLERRE